MKSRILTCTTAMTLFAALAIPVGLAAQEQQEQKAEKPQHYTVTDLGTLGGTFGIAEGINNKGLVDGFATLPGDNNQHVFLWQNGVITDLGTLGGPNSGNAAGGDPVPNERGEVAGVAETSTPDPLGEDTCGYGNHLTCLGFLWQDGVMTPLPTLGGNNGFADGINNRGQVVGLAENTTPLDPTCPPPQVLQFKPVIWEKGEIQELPTFPGDPVGNAVAINDRGQVVGQSFNCTGAVSHALLWQNGTATDLGNLGGMMFNSGIEINNQGQVVGFSDLPGDTTGHAFLWTKDSGIQDLGTLPGDFSSIALAINQKSQVAGFSCDISGNCRAFLWQNGVMTDLNTLIPAGSPLFLVWAVGINSRGEIVGLGFQPSTGEVHAFLATPSNGDAGSESAMPATPGESSERPKIVLPENVRKLLQQRLRFGGFGGTGATLGPIVTLKPTSLTFATQLVGTASSAQPVTLTNTGNTTLSITSITITGADPGDFAQTNTCGSSVPAGKSCTITVTFKPTQRGTRTGAVSITDNAPGSPQKVSLTGTGTVVKLNPTTLGFLVQCHPFFCGRETRTTTLTNVGSTTRSITGITVSGTGFSQSNTCGSSVGAGKSCTISVTFHPPWPGGTFTGSVSVSDDGGGSPQTVSLRGIGA